MHFAFLHCTVLYWMLNRQSTHCKSLKGNFDKLLGIQQLHTTTNNNQTFGCFGLNCRQRSPNSNCTGWFCFTVTPQFQYQKENLPISQSWPFLVTCFTGSAAPIGWLAVFFLVLKLGGTSEKNHPVLSLIIVLVFVFGAPLLFVLVFVFGAHRIDTSHRLAVPLVHGDNTSTTTAFIAGYLII